MNMNKKLLSLLLALCLVMALVPMTAFAEDAQNINVWDGSTAAAFAGGTGTAEDPYQIANGAQLAYLASSVNSGETYEQKNFVLTANIDLNGLPWTPIANSFSDALLGGSDYRVFAGNFDGNGYTISNVSIGSETAPLEADVLGLFGATEGKISNLNLDTVSIHGVAKIASIGAVVGFAGGLVGYSAGSIENCHVTGLTMDMSAPSNVYAAAYWVGGLVGALDGTQLINECSVSGSITEKAGKGSIGGLIGELGKAAKITYSRSNVTVNVKADSRGGADVGGFIGKGNGKTDAETVIRNCYATGNVTGGAYTGGFAGGLWGLNIKNCYASGNVSQAAAAMGSFVGTDASDSAYYGSITNCFTTGSVTGSSPFQYAFAEQSSATKRSEITNCYFAVENLGIKNQNESATEKPQEEMKTRFGLQAIRRVNDNGHHYFISSLQDKGVDDWVTLGTKAEAAALFNPMTGECGEAKVRQTGEQTQVYLQLKSGESVILQTYQQPLQAARPWNYIQEQPFSLSLDHGWKLHFAESEPEIKGTFNIDRPCSWTGIDHPAAKINMGSGVYSLDIELPALQADDWVLDLGDVRESARVRINGQEAGCAWAVPYQLRVGHLLKSGKNHIEIEVTNLPANRIAELDRQGVQWRKFKEINIVDLNYRPANYGHWAPMPSGLNSEVRLIPVDYLSFKTH